MKSYIALFALLFAIVSCSKNGDSENTPGGHNTGDTTSVPKDTTGNDNTDTTKTDENSGDYTLVWEDQFKGESLNMQDWNIEVNGDGGGNNELQYYREENVSVGEEPVSGSSCLILTAKKESYGGRSATSGRVTTQNKQYFKYGKIEASIKFPKTANGLWPAFWMMGNDISTVGWPACGETDIVEMGSGTGIGQGTQDRYFNGASHWGTAWNHKGDHANHVTSSYGLQDTFHLFTLIWDENSMKMYLDQDKYPDVAPYYEINLNVPDDNELAVSRYFRKDNFILFNLAVGGDFTGIHKIDQITALSSGEAKMYVDYIKVYQKK